MARMIPGRVSEHVASRAERKLFDRIRDQLGQDWTVLHSLGVAHHATKPWAEIDFVLIGPPGVICLEVKGGRIKRQSGEWVFIDASGSEHRKAEGPFQQVASATSALYQWLRATLEPLPSPLVCYAVAAPDITWRIEGPDIDPILVYDERDGEAPFSQFVERVVDHWTTKLRLGMKQTLDRSGLDRVIDALRGDFDFRPSLRSRLRQTTDELLALTQEQYRILDGLQENPRVLIRGGAGTGKTLLALEEAMRNVRDGKRVALICSSEILGRHLSQTVEGCTYVRHLHGLLRDLITRAQRTSHLPNVSEGDLFTMFYPEQAIEALADLEELGTIDVLIVDEAQDLMLDSYLDFFDALLDGGMARGSWRFFLDPFQNIFEVMDVPGLKRVLDHEPAQFRLSVNCRNTLQIAIHTSLLSDMDLGSVLRIDGEPVEQHWYEDERDLRRQVSRTLNRLLGGGVAPESIVILGPRRLENSPLALALGDVPFGISASDGGDRKIRYSSIAGFKGLEADVVLVIAAGEFLRPETRSNLYVATSRARALLVVLSPKTAKPDFEELARRLGDRLKDFQSVLSNNSSD